MDDFIYCVSQNGQTPIQVAAFPQYTRRLRVNDHKMALGAVGFERGPLIETYIPSSATWESIRWDTPRLIHSAGEILLVRVAGVTEMADWEVHERFVMEERSSSPLTYSSPLDEKHRKKRYD
jgi:hypothetical protein